MKKINVRGPEKLEPTKHRVVRKIGGAFYLCLPVVFVRHHNIEIGDVMALNYFGDSLRITPVNKEG
jgi:antitoxin component of MazEF toxin-antitoxin module